MTKNPNHLSPHRQWWSIIFMVPFLSTVFIVQSFHVQGKNNSLEHVVGEPAPLEKSTTEDQSGGKKSDSAISDEQPVFIAVDQDPEFPGGNSAMMEFLMHNVRFPVSAREKQKQGTVFVTFVVEADGKITNISILRGVYESLDEEAIRVVKAMPDWTPGMLEGEAVRVSKSLPIRFAYETIYLED